MKKQVTVTIGIPAFNESANIEALLRSLVVQKTKRVSLTKIIVVSDGSTDETVSQARNVKDLRISIVGRPTRLGHCLTQNEILEHVQSDYLILMDADVLPKDDLMVENLLTPFFKDSSITLVGGNTESLLPQTLVESFLTASHNFKQRLYQDINHGDNIYLCHGRIRALHRALYQNLRWPNHTPEDSYLYLINKKHSGKFSFCKNATVAFRCPQTLLEHKLQSTRFLQGKKRLVELFGLPAVKKAYHIPKFLFVRHFLVYLLTNPVTGLGYVGMMLFIRLNRIEKSAYRATFKIAKTSKRIVL
ncbi:glycosyltransferase family 2 protein [Candidatus Microgenomates bacterium]|nr:MAG: glycosyltransferase family 2 protein [Candidatus Microgenomates bacterium]